MNKTSFLNPKSESSDKMLEELNFTPGTEEYRQARKRRQNRESALRMRALKKQEINETQLQLINLTDSNSKIQMELFMLKIENEKLKVSSANAEKGSQIYPNIAILVIVVVLFSLQSYSSSSPGLFSLFWLLLFPLLILALFLK